MTGTEVYRFGDLVLDVSERRLFRQEEPVPLTPRGHDLLACLVRNAGRLVTKQELLDEIWTATFVEEGILSVLVSALRKALGDDPRSPRYIETVARSGYRFIADVRRVAGAEHGAGRSSIAVLPAQPHGTEPSDAERFVGLAIADALIDRLGRFSGIAVRPTRAVQMQAGVQQDAAAIGRSLGVDGVVVSRYEKTPARIRLSAELVRTRDGTRLWHGEYEERSNHDTSAPDAVAASIATCLHAPSSTPRPAGVFGNWAFVRRGASAPPSRPEVYELLGRGRSHLLALSRSEAPKAITAYEAAIQLDPACAAAHAGLALACCQQAELRLVPQVEAYARGRSAALRALALDDSSADAQVALGAISFLGEWDWVGAERSLERALDISPNHSEAYVLYGRLLEARGRLQDGHAMKLRALERDPFSPAVHLAISISYWYQRRYADMIVWANKSLDLDPRHLVAREHLAGAFWAMGDFDRHLAESIRHAEAHGMSADALEPVKQAHAGSGRIGVVRWLLQTHAEGLPAMQLALLYSELGDLDAAIQQLERAIDGHDPCLVDLAVAPQWDRLRVDPRFNRSLARMGLNAE